MLKTAALWTLCSAATSAGQQDPPPRFEVSGSVQTRIESLDERMRVGESGSNQGLFNRVLVALTARDRFTELTAEVMDARVVGEPDDATTTTGQVNTFELLQGYFAARFTDAFTSDDALRVQLGRHTMDVGSRRLVARNVFRNTINAFTGLNAQWSTESGAYGRAFFTLPVQREPGNGDVDALRDGEVEFDRERTEVRFAGGVLGASDVLFGGDLQGYAFELQEHDSEGFATRERHLTTIGARWFHPPARGVLNFEFESAFQFGSSKRSPTSDTQDHDAYLHHATLGYTFDRESRPRLEAVFDIASGDVDPNDDENNRFDSLYGIPRQDFGPTGLFRAIARANLVSPGVRFWISPAPRWNVMLVQRFNYLASDRDSWTNGYVDPTGMSGSHIGNLTEFRVRYEVPDTTLRVEVGAAYHAAGTFAETAPGAMSPNDALYGYVQTTVTF